MMKRNDGFTLVELIVTIAIGSLITLAATTSLLLALRINADSTATIKQQNTTNMLVAVLDKVAQTGEVQKPTCTGNNGNKIWIISVVEKGTGNRTDVVSYKESEHKIYLNNSPFMEDVTDFSANIDTNNQRLTVNLETNDEQYSASVYCRLNTEVTS